MHDVAGSARLLLHPLHHGVGFSCNDRDRDESTAHVPCENQVGEGSALTDPRKIFSARKFAGVFLVINHQI